MRFRNSIRLLMENFKHVFRLVLCRWSISLIASALCCAFVLPELLSVWRSDAVQALWLDVKAFLKAFFGVDRTALEMAKQSIMGEDGTLEQVLDLLASMTTEIALVLMGCVIVYLLKRFAETLCYFTVGGQLNDKMATYAETSFSTSFVSNLGKASVYALAYVPAVFLFDAITIGICYLLLSNLPVLMALFLSMTMIAVFQSLKLTVTGRWMPALTVDGKKLRQAMFHPTKNEKKQFPKVFSMYLVSVYLIIVVNAVVALCTFGSGLILTVPASYFLLICEQYVNYYTVMGKKYFITFERIEKNADYGDSEHFFDYLTHENAQESKATPNKIDGETI